MLQPLELEQRTNAPRLKVVSDSLHHGRETYIGICFVLHDIENGAEDVGHALRVGAGTVLKGVDCDDVDQFLDVVFIRALAEVDPTAVVGIADGVEGVARISANGVSAYSIEEVPHFIIIVVSSNPLACTSKEQTQQCILQLIPGLKGVLWI